MPVSMLLVISADHRGRDGMMMMSWPWKSGSSAIMFCCFPENFHPYCNFQASVLSGLEMTSSSGLTVILGVEY